MLIVTERLRLRPVTLSDAPDTARLMTPAVARNLLSWSAPMSVEDARQRIREGRDRWRERKSLDLAIVLQESDALLGWIGFFVSAPRPEFQLGFWLGEPFQAQGVMTEALLAAVPAVMRRLDTHSLVAESFEDNGASIRLLKHIGMRRSGTGLAPSKGRVGLTRTVKFRLSLTEER